MPRTLHSLLVAAQEGHPDRVRNQRCSFHFKIITKTKKKVAAIIDSGEVGINAADESEITAIQV